MLDGLVHMYVYVPPRRLPFCARDPVCADDPAPLNHTCFPGVYRRAGEQNGKPYWQKVEGSGRIYFKSGAKGWVTNEDNNFGHWEYIAGIHDLPPEGRWEQIRRSEEPGRCSSSARPTLRFSSGPADSSAGGPTWEVVGASSNASR